MVDDFADQPELHRRTGDGALDTLFIRGRHMQISTWVSSQKLRLISAAVRVNMQFICIWRLRNQLELEAVEELSAEAGAPGDVPGGHQRALQLLVHLLPEGQGQHVLQALGGAFRGGRRRGAGGGQQPVNGRLPVGGGQQAAGGRADHRERVQQHQVLQQQPAQRVRPAPGHTADHLKPARRVR